MAIRHKGRTIILDAPGDYIDQMLSISTIYWLGSTDPERGEIVDGDEIKLYEMKTHVHYEGDPMMRVSYRTYDPDRPIWEELAVQSAAKVEHVIDARVKGLFVQKLDHGIVQVVLK